MNLGDMQTQFTGLLNRRDITSTLTTTFFTQGIARIQRELRVPPMEESVQITWSTASYFPAGVPIPADLIELVAISVYDAEGNFVRTLTGASLEETLREARLQGEFPNVYARRGSNYVIGPTPSDGVQLRIDYYAELSALTAPTDSNTLTQIAPDLFIYAALTYASDYYLDKRAGTFEQRYTNIKEQLQDQADLDDLTASKTVGSAYSYQDDLWAD